LSTVLFFVSVFMYRMCVWATLPELNQLDRIGNWIITQLCNRVGVRTPHTWVTGALSNEKKENKRKTLSVLCAFSAQGTIQQMRSQLHFLRGGCRRHRGGYTADYGVWRAS